MSEHLVSPPESITTEEYDVALQELQSAINTSPVIKYGVYDCFYKPDGSYNLINSKTTSAGPYFSVSAEDKKIGSREVEFIDSASGAAIKLIEKEKSIATIEGIDAYVHVNDLFQDGFPNLQILFYYRHSQILSRHVLYADNGTDASKWQPSQIIAAIAEQNRKQLG